MSEEKSRWVVLFLLTLNALGAFWGGWGLMTDTLKASPSWLHSTPFTNYHTPGAILFGIIGGTSLFGAICLLIKTKHRWNFAFFAGVVLLAWILSELILIRQFSWLQVIFGAIGLAVAIVSWPKLGTRKA